MFRVRDVYFGIESGSPNIQKYTNKNLKLDLAQHNLNNVRRSDINYTCSFVVGFSEETSSDLNQTIDLALRCTGTNGTVQVNTVKPYAGSELYSIFQGNICFNDYSLMLDNTLDNDSLRLIKRHPSLFSAFYSMPSQFNINILNLFQVINSHDVLLKAIFSEFENPLTFFTHWHEWRVERNHQSSTPSTFKELGVQCNAFIKHLIDKHYLKIEFTPDLLDYFNTSYDWEFDTLSSPDTASIPSFHDLSTQPRSWIPSVCSHVVIKEFNYDVSSLFDVIENDAVPASYPREKHWVAFIAARVGEETSIYTRELDERSIRILNLADENKSIEDIIHISSESTPSIIEILRLFADCTIVEFRKNAQ